MKKKLILAISFVFVLTIVSACTVSILYNSKKTIFNKNISKKESTNIDHNSVEAKLHPVGSIYISVTDDTVAKVEERFGGTWEAFGAGRILVGAGTGTDTNNTSKEFNVNSTGGEYNHTLTLTEAPAHTHTRGTWNITATFRNNSDSSNAGVDAPGAGTGAIAAVNGTGCGASVKACGWGVWSGFNFTASSNWTGATSSAGGGGAHNNIQPYIAVYMYKRTA